MNPFFQRDVYIYILLLALIMPVFGYLTDFVYRTGPVVFVACTLIGIFLFIWGFFEYRKAKGKKEPRAVDWISKGCTFQIAGNHQEAIIAFTRASELEPNAAIAFYARGQSYWELGNINQAINDFDRAIALNPRFAEAYERRGVSHARIDKYEQAIKDFDMAIALNPKLAVAYSNRGTAHEKLGNPEQAIKDAQAAAQLGHDRAQKLLKEKNSMVNLALFYRGGSPVGLPLNPRQDQFKIRTY